MSLPVNDMINQQLQNLKAQLLPMGAPAPGTVPPPAPAQAPCLAPLTMPALPGVPGATTAMLSIAIDNLPFRYQLSEADLREMCQRWGALQSVQINRDGAREVGVVVFEDRQAATNAQGQLNGYMCTLEGSSGRLAVQLGSPEQLSVPPRQAAPFMTLPGQMMGSAPGGVMGLSPGQPFPSAGPGLGTGPGILPSPGGMQQPAQPGNNVPFAPPNAMGQGMFAQGPSGALPKSTPDVGQDGKGGKGKGPWPGAANGGTWDDSNSRPAWTCKIIIQAERFHHDFPTASKVVGPNGSHVDHIRRQPGILWVRLRGHRSGQMEPQTGQELQEPLALWIAANNESEGRSAAELALDLLKSVCDEHQNWCQLTGHKHPEQLQPQVIENPPDSAVAAGAAVAAAPVGPATNGAGAAAAVGAAAGGAPAPSPPAPSGGGIPAPLPSCGATVPGSFAGPPMGTVPMVFG